MNNRIIANEERFDKLLKCVKQMQVVLDNFDDAKNDLLLLSKYYNSKNWLKDKDTYESSKSKIKAGVLSEDGVWNMLSDIDEIIIDMKRIIDYYESIK